MSFGRSAFGSVAFGGSGGVDESVVSPVAALLADPLAERETLLWARPWDRDTATRVDVYLSGGGYASGIADTWPDGTACAHQLFRARLKQPLRYEARVSNAGVLTGESASTYGDAEIIVADGELAEIHDYDWRTAPVQVHQGLQHWHLREFPSIFNGTAADLRRGVEISSVALRDVTERLRVPAQPRLYRGLGAAWRGDGVDDYGSGTVPCPAGPMGLEGWLRPMASATTQRAVCGWRHLVGAVLAGSRQLFFISGSTNRLVWRVRNDADTIFDCVYTGVPANANTHFYAELDTVAGKSRLYLTLSGVLTLVQETTVTGTFATVWSTFEVMRRPEAGGEYFNGDIDEVRIWNSSAVPRSTASVAELRDRECSAAETGLQDVFHFNEATGATADTGTASGRTLTLTGGQWVSLLDGGADLARKRRITVGGAVPNVEPVSLDGLDLVFELHAGPIQSLVSVMDAGLASFTSAGTVSDVYAWTPVAGQYVTCYTQVASGETTTLIRFGSSPVGSIQCTLQGDNEGGYVADAPGLAKKACLRVLSSDDIDAGSVARATSAKPFAVGYVLYPDGAETTLYGLCVEILGWVSGWLMPSREGLITMGIRGPVAAVVATLTAADVDLDGIEDLGSLVATRRTRVYYARYSHPLSGGDLQSGVARSVREDLGKEYRVEATPEDAAVVAADASAEEGRIMTGIFAAADALVHATEEQAYRSTEHRSWRIPLVGLPHQFSIGNDIRLILPEVEPLAGPLGDVSGQVHGLLVDEAADVYAVEVLV